MHPVVEALKSTAKLAGAVALALWATLPGACQLLVIAQTADFASGLIAAHVTRTVSSRVGWNGVWRKALVWCVVIAFAAAQQAVLGGIPLAQAVAGAFVVIDALSVIENATRAGVNVPPFLRDSLLQWQRRALQPEPSPVQRDLAAVAPVPGSVAPPKD